MTACDFFFAPAFPSGFNEIRNTALPCRSGITELRGITVGSVTALIDIEPEAVALALLRAAETTGRPLGSDDFVTRLEDLMRRRLRREKPRRRAKAPESACDLFAGMNGKSAQTGKM